MPESLSGEGIVLLEPHQHGPVRHLRAFVGDREVTYCGPTPKEDMLVSRAQAFRLFIAHFYESKR